MAFLGIDIGTSGCKALVLSSTGAILASHTATYGLSQPAPGWAEQHPDVWIEGARVAVGHALAFVPADSIKAIGLSGQMHGFTPVDRDGRVVRPAILWNDQRNAREAQEITHRAGGEHALLGFTNNHMLLGYTGGKILWMQTHEPAQFAKVAYALNPKDYLRLVLTGEYATEVSDASGTGLFDVRARTWSKPLLDRMPFDAALLPPCFESHVVSGQVSAKGAQALGLPVGVPVIGGGGDAVIQTLGAGVVQPGVLQTTIGTAGIAAVALTTPADNLAGRLQIFCNVEPTLWHGMGVSMSAGGALAWLRSILGARLDFDTMVQGAQEIAPGAEGLMFLPYLNGERCPHPDPMARGAFIGLTARHDYRHMTRALMEGVVFALYDMYQLMVPMGVPSTLIKASGGGAQSALWRQIQADTFGCRLVTTNGAAEGGAFGAALLAGVACGAWQTLPEAVQCCEDLTRQEPDPTAHAVYQRAYPIYAALYQTLHPTFVQLGTLSAHGQAHDVKAHDVKAHQRTQDP